MEAIIALLVKQIYSYFVEKELRRSSTEQPEALTAMGLLALALM
jgi:hypothetical protein